MRIKPSPIGTFFDADYKEKNVYDYEKVYEYVNDNKSKLIFCDTMKDFRTAVIQESTYDLQISHLCFIVPDGEMFYVQKGDLMSATYTIDDMNYHQFIQG